MSTYGSTVREYRDDPGYRDYRDDHTTAYQDLGYTSFDEVCDRISSNIFSINNGANSIERAMKIIGTDKDSTQLRDKIHETSQSTNKIVGDTTKLLKKLGSSRIPDRQQKLKLDRLKNDFQDSVQRFTSLQKKAAEKVRTTVRLSSGRPKPQPLMEPAGWMDDDDDHARLLEEDRRRQELQAQDQVIDDDLALIREREEQIRELESDILDVNEIFRDLGAMINEQGEAIDTIEANVEKAYSHVEQGTEQLHKASVYQKKSRKKMCILAIIFVIIAAIITIIIVTQVKK